jgi:exodeoxyribonuclease VII large subunit
LENKSYIPLSELAGLVRQAIDRAFSGQRYWVIADIANHTQNKGRHYFDLVEKDPAGTAIIAKLATRIWSDGAEIIAAFEEATGQPFTAGLKLLVQVSVFYHAVHGLQLNLLAIDPNFTLGALERERQATLLRLVSHNAGFIRLEEGAYVTLNQKLRLPKVIQHIAVISSTVSAGLEDFQHTLDHNAHGFDFRVDPYYAYVQGELNAQSVVDQLIRIYHSGIAYDAVVLIRGGGSQTDLLIFEQYALGRAIARFPIPVITGIGHQKNETIADLMAHTAVKTPTKAAELIVARNKAFQDELLSLEKSIIIRSQQLLASHRQKLSQSGFALAGSATRFITLHREILVQQGNTLQTRAERTLYRQNGAVVQAAGTLGNRSARLVAVHQHRLERSAESLQENSVNLLKDHQQRLVHYEVQLRLLSPRYLLKKGFALLKKDGRVLKNGEGLIPGNEIEIVLADQEITAQIKGIQKHGN